MLLTSDKFLECKVYDLKDNCTILRTRFLILFFQKFMKAYENEETNGSDQKSRKTVRLFIKKLCRWEENCCTFVSIFNFPHIL